jgi:thioredoxin reductase (NADPH)
MYFSRYAGHVTILVRGSGLAQSMSQYLIDQISATPNITLQVCCSIVEAHGTERLEAITLEDAKTKERQKVDATSLFIFIGAMPYTDWLDGIVTRDGQGFIPTGPDLMREGRRPPSWTLSREPFLLETNVPGIFVAGDVRLGSVKRVASAVGEGSIAVQFIHRYLSEV